MMKSQHSRLLEQLVAEQRKMLVDSILGGLSEDWYRTTLGKVQGLDIALMLSQAADQQLSGGE